MTQNHPDGYLLGDSGYGVKPFLLTSYLAPATLGQERYNRAHCKTRNTVERAIGVLKRRFACLHRLRVKPERATKITGATIVLHNVARKTRMPMPAEAPLPPPELVGHGQFQAAVHEGTLVRDAVAREFAD